MKILLVAVNAKFSHTNLAVRYLKHALEQAGMNADFAEYTINQPLRDILTDIVLRAPDALLFSCYLWNIDYIRRIGADFRVLFPHTDILLGGPEVSFDAEQLLASMPWADGIICGEGEPVIAQAIKSPRGIHRAADFADLDRLPFPYDDLETLQNRVLYYEASRGCPFGCSYCLSSADRTTRTRSLELVFSDLQRFLDARVMQVKFVDRTFNLDKTRALAIWQYLAAHDNGVTSFQMELGGDLTTQEQLSFLAGVRQGLFQFEIGIQSTCEATLAEICRATDMERLKYNTAAVKSAGNIHQHLDLIAGLPLESFERFAQSYDEVFAIRPEQLQLGFLKLLRGSTLYAKRERYGLLHSENAPYEILQTSAISFAELARLKTVEEMTEVYYNSGRFSNTLAYLLEHVKSPFWAMLALGETMPQRSAGKYEYYDLLFDFCLAQGADADACKWLIKFDICLHERPRRLPACCAGTETPAQERKAAAVLDIPKSVHLERFPFDVTSTVKTPESILIAFDYEQRSPIGHAHYQIMR